MAGELILIVEDNDKNLKLVRDVLQYNGYQTEETMTGEDAIELARLKQPALILMDIQLPGIDGIAALKRLRADPMTERIPVIAITASVMTAERNKILEAGFESHQAKPIKVKEFIEDIRRVLSSSIGRRAKE